MINGVTKVMVLKSEKERTVRKEKIDTELLENIQPVGGISFKCKMGDYVRTGTGYEACIHIYSFPGYVEDHWLSDFCYFEGAITTIDVSTVNYDEAKKNISRSLKEQSGRASANRNHDGVKDAVDSYAELLSLYEDIKGMKKILKVITIRIYVKGRTLEELEKQEKKILDQLDSYKGFVMLNEQCNEYKAIYESYTEQQQYENARIGQPILDEALAAGDPFHFSSLSDPRGLYLGSTLSGGTVNFDMFYKTKIRTYYNVLILGLMGSGKSTLMKKLGLHAYILNDFVRMFDVTGELEYMGEICGAKTINLDGTDGIFNMFQILKTDTNAAVCYARHISKMGVIYEFLSGERNKQEIITYNEELEKLYKKFNIITSNADSIKESDNISELSVNEYPTMSDFIMLLDESLQELISKKAETESESNLYKVEAERIYNIKRTFESARSAYGSILDGYTSFDNIMDIPFVIFNIRNITALSSNIANVILFSIVSMCWDNCTRNGMIMKELYETGQISEDEIVHFLIEFDEAHKIMNANHLEVVKYLTDAQREMRKWFGGLVLGTQTIDECIPDDSSDKSVEEIKKLFALSNYKFIGRQDESQVDKLKKAFGSSLTVTEYERIPKLQQGRFILSIQGDRNIEFNVFASDRELEMFRGGA